MWILIAALGAVALWLLFMHGFLLPRMRRNRVLRPLQKCPPFLLPPLAPTFDRPLQVSGRGHTPLLHQVNLYRLTCTCRRFRTRRGYFPDNDIRRLCHHLRQELGRQNLLERLDPLSRGIIDDRVRDRCYIRATVSGNDVGFGLSPKRGFVRIFARRQAPTDPPEGPFTGDYNKFIFHVSRGEWGGGDAPPLSGPIADKAVDIAGGVILDGLVGEEEEG
ncbi:MAG: hypothetical protein HQL66_13860 [Magnetococcales bacterium]|nr:hypothetical protein [Magnetococcales bacterium]